MTAVAKLWTLTPINDVYKTLSNLKETQIKKVQPEQSVAIKVDAFLPMFFQEKC